jgi:hypothetical protein
MLAHSSGGQSPAFYSGGPGSVLAHVEFMVENVELGQDFSEYVYFGFPCQFPFTIHTRHHPR